MVSKMSSEYRPDTQPLHALESTMPRAKCRAPAKASRDKVGRVVFAFGAVGHRVPHRRLSAKTALQQRRGPDQDNAPALSWATWGVV